MQDPFEEVREEVSRALTAADEQLAKWQRTKSDYVGTQLRARLSGVEMDLRDMDDALARVEAERARFPSLDDAELRSRHAFVVNSRKVVAAHLAELDAEVAAALAGGSPRGGSSDKAGRGDGERDGLLASTPARKGGGTAKGKGVPRGGAAGTNHTEMVQTQLQSQQGMQAEQEEVLDSLHSVVGNLKSMGGAMNEELAQQAAIINDLEGQVDTTSSSLGELKKKMVALMPKKDGRERLMLLVVSVALIVLIVLVLET
mmetsp:Transcript_50853/g.108600  ORF Transcript_50853/g.108600 Transcript_50853/m.108600 type:complete len:258 (-) Transcript_50853:498-1271(-)